MRFGIDIAQQRVGWDELVARAQLAERLGFEGAWGYDHFQPLAGDGPGNCFEGMTTLAALAGHTSTIRLGLLVTGVTHRHPSVLAAEAITVDHASGGRLDLSLGAAWLEREHAQLGIEFPATGARFDLLEDALELITRLLTGETVSYEGARLSLRDARLLPRPVQQPRPPIWIGGSGPNRTLPLVARFADAWHTYAPRAQFRELTSRLDVLAEKEGREPASILRSTTISLSDPIDDIRRRIDRWHDVGVGYLVCSWPTEGQGHVERFADAVLARG